jgi:hypothetical protein
MIRRLPALTLAFLSTLLTSVAVAQTHQAAAQASIESQPYHLDTGLKSRAISFENPTGEPGEGGKAASPLGVGRKGAPRRLFQPGETVTLCDIEGTGTIRHIWLTLSLRQPDILRSFVVRAYWEGREHPSIECPLGDFFGFAHGKVMAYESAVHSVGEKAGLNFWLPMPFNEHARITLSNESDKPITIYYQIDYTLGDAHPESLGRLHTLFRRENTTTEKNDFELLPKRQAAGRYVGAVIGVRNLHPQQWWGEGEVKIYMDGDTEFPTIAGTGTEDYVGLSYGIQQTPYRYHGCSLNENNYISIYRWHLPDPIVWERQCRITVQQIAHKGRLLETEDDWSTATFWYEAVPSQPLPPLPDLAARTANLWEGTQE